MKNFGKILSLVLAMVLCLSCFSVAASAAGNPVVTPVAIKNFADLQNKITDGYTGATQHLDWSEDGSMATFDVVIPEDCYVFLTVVANNFVEHKLADDLNIEGGLYSAGYINTYIKVGSSGGEVALSAKGYALVNAGKYIVSVKSVKAEEDVTVYVGMLPKTTVFTSVDYISSNENSVTVKVNSLDDITSLYIYNNNYGYTNSPAVTGEPYTFDKETGYVTIPFNKDNNDVENTNRRHPFFSYQVTDIFGFKHIEHFAVLCDATTDIQGIVSKTYTGSAQKQSGLKVKCYTSSPSYKLTYKNNVNAGTATMVFEGTGEWIGSVTRTFKINPVKAEKCSVSLSTTSYTYSGKTRTPSVTVKYGSKTLKAGTDYTVTYSSGRKDVGKYGVKVTFKGNYTGSKTVYFNIVPKGTSLTSISSGTKKLTPKWSKQTTQTSGYQVQYCTKSSFSGAKTVTISKNAATASTITGLKANTKYYIRVRTYKTVKVNGESVKLYSSWSSAKSAKTK